MHRPILLISAITLLACQSDTAPVYDLAHQYQKFAPVTMTPDTSFLSSSERAVVNKLIEASAYMSEIYLRQINARNPGIRAEITASRRPDKALLLNMFDLHFSTCDGLADNHVFYGTQTCPPGGGFYPADMSQTEFENWLTTHPEDRTAFTSAYTIIRRFEDQLVAIPYSQAYRPWLEPAATLLREAAELSENANLKKFLNLRANAFLSDDYFESELAWMDLDGRLEIAIGPYEVYDDQLFGYKTAFESFITIKNPQESKSLAKYKKYLRDMEANLPVEDHYKNFKRGFSSPIALTDQIHGGGDNQNGVQTIAFNLPNDERVREAKGAKKVILNNVLGAKYDHILAPIGERVLVEEQARLTTRKYMGLHTLFHELSHSLGPGSITVNNQSTTVNAQFKELYAPIEEGKADVMGAYNILYMMQRGELPINERESFLATYFSGLFRSMRFGVNSAHAKGAAWQYTYMRKHNAVQWIPKQKHYRIDWVKMEQAIEKLTAKIIRLQAHGDYIAAQAFLNNYVHQDEAARAILKQLNDIPYDIRPLYPDKI